MFQSGKGDGNVTSLRGGNRPTADEKKDKAPSKRTRTGRTDKGGQEAVINQTLFMQKLPQLVKLIKAKDAAADDLSDAVKKVAEQTGYFAKVVLRRAKAEAGEDYADQQKEARQLSLIFEVETPFLKG